MYSATTDDGPIAQSNRVYRIWRAKQSILIRAPIRRVRPFELSYWWYLFLHTFEKLHIRLRCLLLLLTNHAGFDWEGRTRNILLGGIVISY